MAAYPIIDEWSFSFKGGITGTVTSSPFPEFENGEILTTSKIVTNRSSIVDGTIVETASGSRYILGTKKGGSLGKKLSPPVSVPLPVPVPAPASIIPTLDNWTLTTNNEIIGNVSNNSGTNFKAGEKITTSSLLNKRLARDGGIVTTISGSKYKLGKQQRAAPVPAPVPVPVPVPVQKAQPATKVLKAPVPAPVPVQFPATIAVAASTSAKVNPAFNMRNVEEVVPVLDNWYVNRRDCVIGVISNSPFANEKDGKIFTTTAVATNMAFVEEGFTVVTVNNRKFKLGVPKGGSKMDYNDEMAAYVTPTLNNWDIYDDLKVTGTVQGSGNRNVPDGTIVTTDQVISESEFIQEGFTICTQSGMMYKLGRRQTGRKAAAPAPAPVSSSVLQKVSFPEVSLPNVSVPKFSFGGTRIKQQEDAGDTGTAPVSSSLPQKVSFPEVSLPNVSLPKFSFGGNKQQADAGGTGTGTDTATIPRLEDWNINSSNQVTGVVTNSIDRDGETLTTSELSKRGRMKEGTTVYTKSGSAYILGKRQPVASAFQQKKADSTATSLPILNNWAFTGAGGISGTVTNCPDPDVEDGEILTTSKLENSVELVQAGDTVVTMNGSTYLLGAKREVGPTVESPPTPLVAGIWFIAVLIFVTLNE